MQFLGREGRAVNSVLSDAAPRHHDAIARQDLLCVTALSVDSGRHDSTGAAIHEGLPEVTLVKYQASVHRRDAAFVPAVFHPFPDPFVDPPRVENPLRQGFFIVGRGEAEDIRVEDQLGPHAAAERVSVHADDTGKSAAVRIERRRGVVGFHLEDEVPVFVEADDSRIVDENGEAPVGDAHSLPDQPGRTLDVCGEERVDFPGQAFAVIVGDPGVEDLVLAVLRPGLGEAFEFRVGDFCPQTDLFPAGKDIFVFQIVPEDLHLLQRQREDPLLADPDEFIIGTVQVDLLCVRTILSGDKGDVGPDSVCRIPGFPVQDIVTLDEIVGE